MFIKSVSDEIAEIISVLNKILRIEGKELQEQWKSNIIPDESWSNVMFDGYCWNVGGCIRLRLPVVIGDAGFDTIGLTITSNKLIKLLHAIQKHADCRIIKLKLGTQNCSLLYNASNKVIYIADGKSLCLTHAYVMLKLGLDLGLISPKSQIQNYCKDYIVWHKAFVGATSELSDELEFIEVF